MAGLWRRQWEGIVRHQRWHVPAQQQLREDIESLAEKTINETTLTGDTEAFVDVVQKVDALLQRSEAEKESGGRQLRGKLRNVLHQLQVDANTQQELEQRIQNFLDPLMEFDPFLPNGDWCIFHVELEGIMHRDMDFYLPRKTPGSHIQERVAQNLDLHPSRLQILDSRYAAPTGDGTLNMCLRLKLQHPNYREQMMAWPEHALTTDLADFIHSLADRPLGSTPDKTWATSGEFSDIVRDSTPLLTPGTRRGPSVEGDACKEVLDALKDYMNEHARDATPAGLLKFLTEEFLLATED